MTSKNHRMYKKNQNLKKGAEAAIECILTNILQQGDAVDKIELTITAEPLEQEMMSCSVKYSNVVHTYSFAFHSDDGMCILVYERSMSKNSAGANIVLKAAGSMPTKRYCSTLVNFILDNA